MNIMKLVGEMGTVMNMQLTMKRFVMSAVACGVVQVVSAQVAITQVVPMSTADQGTELRVMFNGLPVQPKAYQLESPSRLILDFEGTTNSVGNNVSVNTTEIGSVEVLEDAERSRLTINLKDHGAFTTRTEGNTFILKVAPEFRENVGSTDDLQANLDAFTALWQCLPERKLSSLNQMAGEINFWYKKRCC